MSRKLIFLIFLTIFMISFLLICDRSQYFNHITNQFIGINNSSDIQSSFDLIKSFKKFKPNISFGLNNSDNEISSEELLFYKQHYNAIKEKVLKLESEVFVPIRKPKDSKLIYSDEIKGITGMTIGDYGCDQTFGKDLTVVIFVITRVDGFKRRSIIRQTWAKSIKQNINTKMYFAIGLTENKIIQKKIFSENKKFGDILQWNFIDNYYNLTIKSIAILRWAAINCFNTKFIYKVDDDCILNINNLLNFCDKADEHTIYGHLWRKAIVIRENKNKFFISKADYPKKFYPDYTGGPWLISGSVVPSLYETTITKSLPALPYEDVYITGVVASKLNLNRKTLEGLVYFDKTYFTKLDNCWFSKSIIFWQNLDDLTLIKAWNQINSTQNKVCNETDFKTSVKPINKL